MKTFYLIQTAFVAATSWATSDGPWGFFARVEDRHVPLSFPDPHGEDLPALSYSDATQKPTPIFYANATAKTSFGFVGVAQDFLVHGLHEPTTALKLGSDNCFISPNFFRCSFPKVRSQLIQTRQDNNCVPVRICLEKFDKDTGKAEEIAPKSKDGGLEAEYDFPEDEYVPPEDEEYTQDEHVPHTLFVNNGFGLRRVRISRDGRTFQRTSSNLKPVRVYYRDHKLFTKDRVTKYLGFQNGALVQSPNEYSSASFELLPSGEIVDTIFTLCQTGFYFIETLHEETLQCDRAKVYLLPYDTSGNPTQPQDALPETEVYRPQDTQFPFVLFAKVEGTYHAVGGLRVHGDNYEVHGPGFEQFAYGLPEPPFEFDLGVHALSTNTVNGGYVSFPGNQAGLHYNSTGNPYVLDLDQRGRIQNKTFYSCMWDGDGTYTIHTTRVLECCCYEADMYFGKYNRETREYMEASFEEYLPRNGTMPEPEGV